MLVAGATTTVNRFTRFPLSSALLLFSVFLCVRELSWSAHTPDFSSRNASIARERDADRFTSGSG